MSPIDHISTGVEYSFCPNNISGALYHKVKISCVKVLIGTPKDLARPKSATFIIPSLSINKFWGFKSRWRILFEWQKFIAINIWNK